MLQRILQQTVSLRNSIKENQDAAEQVEKSGLLTEAANRLYQVAKDWCAANADETIVVLRQHYYQKALSFAEAAYRLAQSPELQAFITEIKSHFAPSTEAAKQTGTSSLGLFTQHTQSRSYRSPNHSAQSEAAPLIGSKATL